MGQKNKNVDWDFILSLEGFKLNGYVPDSENSDSGPTIASGFDLGSKNENDLIGLPDHLIQKFKPYLGLKGEDAKSVASSLSITNDEAKLVNEFSKKKVMNHLSQSYLKNTLKNFNQLPRNQATIMASVALQYGSLKLKTPKFYNHIVNDDWESAENELRNFGDRYPSRRIQEADYLLNNKEVVPKKSRLKKQ